jgi:hypothetical protein
MRQPAWSTGDDLACAPTLSKGKRGGRRLACCRAGRCVPWQATRSVLFFGPVFPAS